MCERESVDNNGVPRSAPGLLADIQWNCENCTARLDYEASVKFSPQGTYENPCRGCKLQKYGYGGEV